MANDQLVEEEIGEKECAGTYKVREDFFGRWVLDIVFLVFEVCKMRYGSRDSRDEGGGRGVDV